MAINPAVQEKLHEELDTMPPEDQINDMYEAIQELEYLEMCVNGKKLFNGRRILTSLALRKILVLVYPCDNGASFS